MKGHIVFLISLLLVECYSVTLNHTGSPNQFTTKPHLQKLTKPTAKPKPSCHPFNLLCMPCKAAVQAVRISLIKVVAIHKEIEKLCSKILGQHFICDTVIKITVFYLDHTPNDRVCKRFFLCGNNGFLDWWWKADYPMSQDNATLLEILGSPLELSDADKIKKQKLKSHIIKFFESTPDFSFEELPENVQEQVTDFLIAFERAAIFVQQHKNI